MGYRAILKYNRERMKVLATRFSNIFNNKDKHHVLELRQS